MKAYTTPNIQSFKAGEDLSGNQYRFVKFHTSVNEVVAIDAVTDIPCGVQMNAPESGEAVEVAMIGGGAKLIVDAGIAAGKFIGTGVDGKGELVAPGSGTLCCAISDAIGSTTSSANDIIPVILSYFYADRDAGDVITTEGDVIQGGTAGVPERLAVGAAKTRLTSNGTKTAWVAPVITTEGDLMQGGASGVEERLATGTAGQVLQTNGTKQSYAHVGATQCAVTAGTIAASKPVVLDAAAQQNIVDFSEALKVNGTKVPSTFTFAAAAGAANVSEVTVTAKDAAGNALTGIFMMLIWLSDAATGLGLTATTASGTVQAKAASGADFGALTSKKALLVQTLEDGTYILEITDTAKTAFYVAASPVGGVGVASVSAVLATADYGA